MSVCPAKTPISLGIRPVWSESSLCAWRNLGSLATHWAHGEDSDQTGRMPRLIWVFAGRTLISLVLSWGGSVRIITVVEQGFFTWGLQFCCLQWLKFLFCANVYAWKRKEESYLLLDFKELMWSALTRNRIFLCCFANISAAFRMFTLCLRLFWVSGKLPGIQ